MNDPIEALPGAEALRGVRFRPGETREGAHESGAGPSEARSGLVRASPSAIEGIEAVLQDAGRGPDSMKWLWSPQTR